MRIFAPLLLAATLLATPLMVAGPVAAQTPAPGPAPQTHGATPQGRVGTLIGRMQEGGVVLVIRHERTEVPSREDDYTRPANDCTAQRNLSVAGSAGGRETGFALQVLNVAVTRVITSPMCRAAETARFMFGTYVIEHSLIHPNPGVEGGRNVTVAGQELVGLLRTLPSTQGNTAIVSHAGNIAVATGLRLAEGEIGVVQVHTDGRIEALGQVMGSDLGAHARSVLARPTQ